MVWAAFWAIFSRTSGHPDADTQARPLRSMNASVFFFFLRLCRTSGSIIQLVTKDRYRSVRVCAGQGDRMSLLTNGQICGPTRFLLKRIHKVFRGKKLPTNVGYF
jgi:hypothetical protein